MRNKLFILITVLLMMAAAIGSPLRLALMRAGVIPYTNTGNIIELERVYAGGALLSDLLNGVEQLKRDVTDTYVNYLPFFDPVLEGMQNFMYDLNRPVVDFLTEEGMRIFMERQEAASGK